VRYDAAWRPFTPPHPYGRGHGDRGYADGREWSSSRPPQAAYDDGLGGLDGRGIYGPARYGLGPYHERLRRRRRSDDDLRVDVEEALFYDTWVDADAVTVEVQDGIVTLRGDLPNYDEIRFATDDAWDVEGVLGVRTELRVTER
jgi:hypothetical protein